MKKTLLYLGLLASTSAFAAGELSFLESLLADKTTPHEAVMQNVAAWAQQPMQYLSLGESHLEAKTANQVNFQFAKLYIDSVQNGFTFCAETLDHFLSAEEGKWIMAKSDKNLIFKGNGPARTDFQNCNWSADTNAITYSGFFHQYPFARPWPNDFPPTPVTREEGNNIRAQLSPRKGMFITQMEMSFLESRAASSLLKTITSSPSAFRARVETLVETVREVVSEQVKLIDGTDYTNKYGAFYSREAFAEILPMPEEAWFVLTNRGYRLEREPFPLFQQMLKLPTANLDKLISKLSKEKSYYYSFGFGPNEAGVPSRTTFAGLELDGEAELIQFVSGDVIVLDTNATELACYKKGEEGPKPVVCSEIF